MLAGAPMRSRALLLLLCGSMPWCCAGNSSAVTDYRSYHNLSHTERIEEHMLEHEAPHTAASNGVASRPCIDDECRIVYDGVHMTAIPVPDRRGEEEIVPNSASRSSSGNVNVRQPRRLLFAQDRKRSLSQQGNSVGTGFKSSWSRFQNVPVFWINSDGARERRESMEKQMKQNEPVQHQRVPAFVSADIERFLQPKGMLAAVKYSVKPDVNPSLRDAPESLGTPLQTTYSYAELGCVTSHMRAISAAAANPSASMALVIEDDMLLTAVTSMNMGLKKLASLAPPDWLIIQLHLVNPALIQIFCETVSAPFVPWQPMHWSTGAYLIKRRGMLKLLNMSGFPNDFSVAPTMVTADKFLYAGLRPHAYTYTRPLFEIYHTPSLIQPLETQMKALDGPAQELAHQIISRKKSCRPLRLGATRNATRSTSVRQPSSFPNSLLHSKKEGLVKAGWGHGMLNLPKQL